MGKKINYKSDFVLRERFRDGGGRIVPLPDVDFTLQYWTRPGKVYEVSRKGGTYVNCVADGDGLLVVFKDHGLHEGTLKRELHLSLDNALMSDGKQEVYYVDNSEIELWHLSGTEEGVVESELVAAYTRGYKFTWEDFTEADKAELKQPATDAAKDCEKRTDSAIKKVKEECATAVEAAGKATDSAREATEAATKATADATAAKEQSEVATKESKSATEAAREAAREAKTATDDAKSATEDSKSATASARQATEASAAATKKAATATDYAEEAAQAAATAAEELAATRAMLEELTARAEKAARAVPTGLKVEAPARVTIGNTVTQYVSAAVKPDSALQNVVMLTDGESVKIEPDGRIVTVKRGKTRVHVIPTAGVAYYKTVEIEAVMPSLRMAGGGMRLDGGGNIRLT